MRADRLDVTLTGTHEATLGTAFFMLTVILRYSGDGLLLILGYDFMRSDRRFHELN